MSNASVIEGNRTGKSNRQLAIVFALIASCMAGAALCGWAFDLPVLFSIKSHWASMKVNTACSILVCAAALCVYLQDGLSPPLRLRVVRLCGFFLIAVAVLTLVQYLLPINLHIDELLLKQPMGTHDRIAPGRPSPVTVLSIFLLGAAMAIINKKFNRAFAAQSLALSCCAANLLVVLGYIFEAGTLYGCGPFSAVSLTTGVSFILLSLSILFSEPELGLVSTFTSPTSTGRLLRQCSLIALMAPVIVGWFGQQAQLNGVIGPNLGLALMVTSTILVSFCAVFWITRKFQSIEQSLENQLRFSRCLVEVSTAVGQSADQQAILQECCQLILLDLHGCLVRIWLHQEQDSHPVLGVSAAVETWKSFTTSSCACFGSGPSNDAGANQYNSLIVNFPDSEPGRSPRREPVRFARHPLAVGERRLGCVELFTTQSIDTKLLMCLGAAAETIARYLDSSQAASLLRQQERKFKAIFDHTFEFIGLMSLEGILLDGNSTALEFAGVAKEEVIGKPFWETPWWKHSKELQEKLKKAVVDAANGQFIRFEATHLDANGLIVHVDFSLKPIFDDAGKVVLLIPEGRDITAAKEAETRVSEFYSTVSHELRTPLTSIRGSLGLIEGGLTGEISEKTLQFIRIARTESDRLIRLINDILDLRKIEAGMLELKIAPISAPTLVDKAVDGMRGMAQVNGVDIATRLNASGTIQCDEDRIIQVLTNLMSNAIKFSKPGTEMVVSLDSGNPGFFKFFVADQGPGIARENMHKLFGKFQQIDQSDTRQQEGTGLGLAITKAIVEQHNGTIGVESEVGKGSTFWIQLPASLERQRVSGRRQALAPAVTAGSGVSGGSQATEENQTADENRQAET